MTELFVLPESGGAAVPRSPELLSVLRRMAEGTFTIDLERLADSILDVIQGDAAGAVPPESTSGAGRVFVK